MEQNKDETTVLLPIRKSFFASNFEKLKQFQLEPCVIIVVFAWEVSVLIIPNQLLKQTCLSKGFNESLCFQFDVNNVPKEIEETVQPVVADILTVTMLMLQFFPGILSVLVGPWSDNFGRKKIICAIFCGYSISLISFAVVGSLALHLSNMSPWMYVIPYIPITLTGGYPILILMSFCYVTDITNESNRSFRLSMMEMLTFVGSLVGTAASSYLLTYTSAVTVFKISSTLVVPVTVYTIFYLRESIKVSEQSSNVVHLNEVFSLKPVNEMLKVCTKQRFFNERAILLSVVTIMMFNSFAIHGKSTVFYLFVRQKFNWTLKNETLYVAGSFVISLAGGFSSLMLLKKVFNISDVAFGTIAVASKFIDSIVKMTAKTGFVICLSAGFEMFNMLLPPMCRSIIASVIPKNEIGKMYSFTSGLEAVTTLVAPPFYAFVYESTYTSYPGAFYLITATVCIFNLSLFNRIKKMKRDRDFILKQIDAEPS